MGPRRGRFCKGLDSQISVLHILIFMLWVIQEHLYCVNCQDQYPPKYFTHSPQCGSIVQTGGFKLMTCRAYANPSPVYQWRKNGSDLPGENNSQLRISQVQRDDAGFYQCMAYNDLGTLLSESCEVVVAYMDPFLTSTDQDIPIQYGNAVVLQLPKIDSIPAPTMDWYLGQNLMDINGPNHYITLKNNLALLDISDVLNDNIYHAEALNGQSGDSAQSGHFTLKVQATNDVVKAPTMEVPPKDLAIVADFTTTVAAFECVVNARPIGGLQTKWYRINGATRTEIIGDDTKYLFDDGRYHRKLQIRTPVASDRGVYECEAELLNSPDGNTYPKQSARANLTVYEKPVIDSVIDSIYSKDYAETVQVPCTATGNPTPTIHWYFNGADVASLTSNKHTVQSDGTIVITALDLEDSGMYQCFAKNVAGEIVKSTWVKVNSLPPELTAPPQNLTVVEGSDARLSCSATGAPKPAIFWVKVVGGVAQSIAIGGRFQIMDGSDLLITTTQASDSGQYRCNVTNSRGSLEAEAYLAVLVRTQITAPPQNVSKGKGENAMMPCSVSHDPHIQVQLNWYKFDRNTNQKNLLSNSSRISISGTGTLQIMGVYNIDIGYYQCEVISLGGNDSRKAYLSVLEIPHQPVLQTVVVMQSDLRSVNLTWQPGFDGYTPIIRFIIQYRQVLFVPGEGIKDSPEEGWVTYPETAPSDNNWFIVSGLRPARSYQFRVSAINSMGEGAKSVPKPVPPISMPEQAPSGPPKGFFGSARSNSSIMLQWQAPDEDKWNGDLLGYTIRFKLADYPSASYQMRNATIWPLTSYEVTNLIIFQEYEIQIAAFNSEGVGVYTSSIRVATMEGTPDAPPRDVTATTINSTTVEVTWRPPDAAYFNGVNLGYKIYMKELTEPEPTFRLQVAPDPNNPVGIQTAHVHNLNKFTNYTLKVTCYTSKGNGPFSSLVAVKTEEDVPGPVGSLSFANILDISLKVIWTPPTEVNGILLEYKLEWMKRNSTELGKSIDLQKIFNDYTIRGLSPSTNYTILVRAKTAKGYGPSRSADIQSGVPPEQPTAPINLGVSNIEASSVLLQFIPGYDGKTSITTWIVQGQQNENTTWGEVYRISKPGATSLTVLNLLPYAEYRLRMIAVNIVGPSLPSVPTRKFQTLQAAPSVPPDNVTVRAQNATALRISWAPLSKSEWNGAPRGYQLFYKLKENPVYAQIDLNMDRDNHFLNGLEEWMEYQVRMKAYNDVGSSGYSPITTERTREATPTDSPKNVNAIPVSSTSVNVSWSDVPALDQNGLISGYKVQYESAIENIPPVMQDVPGNQTYSVLIQGLRKFVSYQMQVLAYTRMGDGVLSVPKKTVKTIEDKPGPPVIVWFPQVTYTTAKVLWSPPLEPNGIVSGYMVSFRIKNLNIITNSSELPSTQFEYTVATLQRETYYLFSVTARTHLGWGTPAEVLVYTMINRTIPDRPSLPTITSEVGPRSVVISWQPAFDGYGPLRNYTIQYRSQNEGWSPTAETVPPELNSYKVTGLHPNTQYWFRVAATNDVGMSPFSDESLPVMTLEALPEGAPQNPVVVPVTTVSVRVSWQQPPILTWNGVLLGYIIQYKQVDMNSYAETQVDYRQHTVTLDQLTKDVNYEIRIIAFNSMGNGPPSTPTIVYVGEAAPAAAPMNILVQAENSTELMVHWQPPPPDKQNGALSGYKIQYWMTMDGLPSAVQIIVREKQALLQSLQIFANYSVTVQAYNLAGEGPKSNIFYGRTLEGLPEIPDYILFTNITLTSLNVSWAPPIQPNGIIIGYELTYSLQHSNEESRLVKLTVSGSRHYVIIDKVEENGTYFFSVKARTSVGFGPERVGKVTMGPQPGSPGRPNPPSVEMTGDSTVILRWQGGKSGDSDIIGYRVEAKSTKKQLWETAPVYQTTTNITEARFSFPTVCSNDGCQFRIRAFNWIGISHASNPSEVIAPLALTKPFHYEWWFAVIMALSGLIVILLIISCLCLVARRGNKDKKKATPTVALSTTNLESLEPEDGGFATMEMRRSNRRSMASSRNGNARTAGIYGRAPPRPSPASVTYSDYDDGATAKSALPDDDDDDDISSVTEKPSNYGDSLSPSDEESDDSDKLPPPPSSPPPPPFTANPYVNDLARRSWRQNSQDQHQQQPQTSHYNAYTYTDSEAESSHYALSLTGGQMIINNAAGSRAPLPGFSSFV
ncbi:protein sidekick-like [Mizuhopecten yessoensis]|uniref:Protein sidekick n=1 Tax=Mizuhopecten yessoensis TaxID=6573 RepID=A0A210PUJ9_MIZYE|nr:protein sidekick-like [Mizuhopecten yessoensis]OWF40124.1 Protein sidekick [Mizuhopecten yessoensis]